MNRIEILRQYFDNLLLNMSDVYERRCAYIHLYGVTQFCALKISKGESKMDYTEILDRLGVVKS